MFLTASASMGKKDWDVLLQRHNTTLVRDSPPQYLPKTGLLLSALHNSSNTAQQPLPITRIPLSTLFVPRFSSPQALAMEASENPHMPQGPRDNLITTGECQPYIPTTTLPTIPVYLNDLKVCAPARTRGARPRRFLFHLPDRFCERKLQPENCPDYLRPPIPPRLLDELKQTHARKPQHLHFVPSCPG